MNPVPDTTPGVVSSHALSRRLLTLAFIHQISWVGLKSQWRKFEQNRKAKALPPGDSCCTRSPPGRSGSALTCSFLSKKLSCRGLGRASALGWGWEDGGAAPWRTEVAQLHPSQGRTCAGASLVDRTLNR